MRISLVISTYNRGRQLMRTLDSVVRQNFARPDAGDGNVGIESDDEKNISSPNLPATELELIVVDNNSSDDTPALLAGFAVAHPELDVRVVRETRQGLSWARNRGIAESRGEIIVMIDDDEEIRPGFLAAYAGFFGSHPFAVAAGGKMIACYEEERPKWMSRYTEALAASTIDLGDRTRPFPRGRYPIGGNMAFRREVFEKYGLFSTELGRTGNSLIGGEEKDLFMRITRGDNDSCLDPGESDGTGSAASHKKVSELIWWVPGAVVDHIIPPSRVTKEHFVKQSRMVGVSGRIIARSKSQAAYLKAIIAEGAKWAVTLGIALWFVLTACPSKACYLVMMRWNISKGLISE